MSGKTGKKGRNRASRLKKYLNFRLDEPNISRWIKQNDSVLKAAGSEHKNLSKIRQ